MSSEGTTIILQPGQIIYMKVCSLENNIEVHETSDDVIDYVDVNDNNCGDIQIQVDCEQTYTVKLPGLNEFSDFLGKYLAHQFNNVFCGSAGDPHIDPLYGERYELPFIPNCYRMLEGTKLFMNVETQSVTDQEKQNIIDYFLKITKRSNFNDNIVTSGCFYKSIYISSDNEELFIDLDNQSFLYNETSNYFKIKEIVCDRCSYGSYKHNKLTNSFFISFVHSIYGKFDMYVEYFVNPQIKNGFRLHFKYKYTLKGLLIREYNINHYTLRHIKHLRVNKAIRKTNPVYTKFVRY